MKKNITTRTVLITGASRGIGAAIAESMGKRGWGYIVNIGSIFSWHCS